MAFLALRDGPLLRVFVAGALVAGHCERAGRCKLALGVVEAPSLGTHLVQASRGRLTLDSHVRVDLCELDAIAVADA